MVHLAEHMNGMTMINTGGGWWWWLSLSSSLGVSSLWVSWRHGCRRSEGCDKTLVLDKI